MVLFFITLYLTTELGFSVATAGKMVSIYGLGSMAGAYLGGWLTDRVGPIIVQIVSFILSGIGFIILSFIKNPVVIMLYLFFLALVSESFRPANITAIAQICTVELQPRGYTLNRLALNLGIAIGPAVGGFLAKHSYNYLFWLDGLTCIVSAIFLCFFRNSIDNKIITENKTEAVGSKSPWQDRIFLCILLLVLANAIIFTQLFNTWPIYLNQIYKLLEDKIGLLLTWNTIIIVLIEMPLIHKLEKKNTIKIIALGSMLLAGGFAILPFGSDFRFAGFAVTIWTFGEILVLPLLTVVIAKISAGQNQGKYMGLFSLSFSAAFIVGPLSGTWIYENWGPNQLWYLIGVLGMFTAVGFLFIDRFLKAKSG